MPRFLLLALVLGGSLVFILKIFFDFWAGISGTRSAVFKDVNSLLDLIADYNLTPWNHKEINLISRLAEVNTASDLVSITRHGVYFSIYHEPMLAYAVKEYRNNGKKVICMRFNDQSYSMIWQKGKGAITKDKEEIGQINLQNGVELKQGDQKVFIDSKSTAGLVPVELNGEYTMSVIVHAVGDKDQSRVLKQVKDHDDEEGELLLMTIAYALIEEHI